MRFLKKRIGLNIKHRLLNLKKIEHKHTIDFFFFQKPDFPKTDCVFKTFEMPVCTGKNLVNHVSEETWGEGGCFGKS